MKIFTLWEARIHALYGALRAAHERRPAEFWRKALFCSLWLFLALFPIGYGWREVMPLVCLFFLALYYRHGWRDSVLAHLKPVWFFGCAALMTLIGIICSTDPWSSLLHAGTGVNKAFILPFIAMECATGEQDLRRLAWAMAFACFWEGLDGIWQAFTGLDFIMGYAPHSGRLTGSLGDYSVGNYLALALVPAFGIWFVLRERLGAAAVALIFFALFWPAFFLFAGASSRSGVLAIAGALAIWAFLAHGWRSPRILLYPALVFASFMIAQPHRLSAERVINDDRWDLWRLGWKVFMEHPIFGAGAGQYNAAFRSLGLRPAHEVITISHPHNLYLDMLYAHGVAGCALGLVFVGGFLWWGFQRIRRPLRRECEQGGSVYWRLTAWFWLGYAAWLINGIFGHDFYRTWWLALAMCSLGIMAGAIVSRNRSETD